MRFCKYCGSRISDDDKFCQECGGNVTPKSEATVPPPVYNTFEPNPTFVKSKKHTGILFVLIGGAIAAIVIIVIVACIIANALKCDAAGCNSRAIWGKDYCVSHTCIYCDNKRVSGSYYCYSHYKIYDSKTYSYDYNYTSSTNKQNVYSYELRISNVKLSSNTSYTIAEGTITNNSKRTVNYVKIKGSFKNSAGTVIDTDWTYAVGTEGLAPGESCTWRMSVKKDYSIKECTVSILDFDY